MVTGFDEYRRSLFRRFGSIVSTDVFGVVVFPSWSCLVGSLVYSNFDFCKFLLVILGGSPVLFWALPIRVNFFSFSPLFFLFVFLFAMAYRSFPRTLSVDVSCFMQSHSREDVAKIMFDKYNEVFGTPTIQILPGG